MTTYAGEIRIKTKLDTKEINEGMKAVSAKLGGIVKAMAIGTAAAIVGVVAVIASIGGALVKIFKEMSKMDGFKEKFEELNLAFANLKNAAYSALMPIFNALLPIIMQVVDWLTRAANVAAAFIAALSGASTYMVYVASSLSNVGGSSGTYADNMERAEKAAKGSLASFDKLNVLQQEKEPETPETGGGGGGGGTGSWIEMPIDEDLQEKANKVKEIIEKIKNWFIGLWDGIKDVWSSIGDFFKRLWENPKETTKKALDDILNFFIKLITVDIPNWGKNIWNWLKETLPVVADWAADVLLKIGTFLQELWHVFTEILGGIWEWAKENIIDPIAGYFKEKVINPLVESFKVLGDTIKLKITETLDRIKEKWQDAKDWFDEIWQNIKTGAIEKWDSIKLKITGVWDSIKEKWQEAKDWFQTTIIDPIVSAWDTATSAIKNFFVDMWDGIKQTTKTVINSVIEFINKMINGVVGGVNAVIQALNKLHIEIPDWVPLLGGKSFGFNITEVTAPQIPLLATGAVIPPNAPFAAILGDQRHGTNIEAPEGLLRQIIQDEMRGMNNQPQTIHNVLKLDGRVVYESWDRENRRVGGSMLTKGTAGI